MEIGGSDIILVSGSAGGLTEEKRVERGIGSKLTGNVVNAVSVSALRNNMDAFFRQIREILRTGGDRIGDFRVSEIEISAQITGEGQVMLVGSGVKAEAQGGIKFTLCRLPAPPDS